MEKVRFQMRISPDTNRRIESAMQFDNCQSKNEFVENALRFYCNYLSANNAADFLPPALVSALRGTVQDSENRTARLLFKLTVEISILMNVLAAGMEVSEHDLDQLRARCIQDVKKTNGCLTFKDAVRFQKGF